MDPDAVSNVITSYQSLLDRMAASDLPETSQYRVDIEKIARYRIKVAMENAEDPEMVEELCQCGQVEELAEQAKDEMLNMAGAELNVLQPKGRVAVEPVVPSFRRLLPLAQVALGSERLVVRLGFRRPN